MLKKTQCLIIFRLILTEGFSQRNHHGAPKVPSDYYSDYCLGEITLR